MTTIPISLQQSDSALPSTDQIHLLPLRISYSGPAKVSAYFDPQPVPETIHSDSSAPPAYKAYLRGRLLCGNSIALPEGYIGQVWKSNAPTLAPVQPIAAGQSARKKRGLSDALAESSGIEANAQGEGSPRRSPRKHASTASAPATKKQKLNKSSASNKASKQKQKRVKYAMSPDQSPVQETADGLEEVKEELVLDMEEVEQDVKLEKGEAEAEDAPQVLDTTMEALEQVQATPTSPEKASRASTPPPPALLPEIHTLPSTPSRTTPFKSPQPPPFSPPPPSQEAIEDDLPPLEDEQGRPQRVLKPLITFNSFMLWNPDTAPDLGDDCYAKSIAEWTALAGLIHS